LGFRGPRGEELRVGVLEDHLVRVQMRPDGTPRLRRTWMVAGPAGDTPREGRDREDLAPFAQPGYALEAGGETVRVTTETLDLRIHMREARLEWRTRDGRPFAADLPDGAYAYDRAGRAIFHHTELRPTERYYGFGEASGPLDKAGRRVQLRPINALGYDAGSSEPLYKHFPFYITFNGATGIAYGLFYDNLASSVFDLGCEVDDYRPRYRYYQADDGDIDCYLIFGPDIAQVVERFSHLTGRMALPPRWSLGYLGSGMTYGDLPDPLAAQAQFLAQCREHDIPCDLFHMSSGYTRAADGRRYVFTWARDRYPEPREMVDMFHRAGVRLAANIKPGFLTTHPDYTALAEARAFVRRADTEEPEVADWWAGERGAYLDFTNAATYRWWQEHVRDALLAYGIDATWNDNNEYPIWDDDARCAGFGDPLRIGLIRPLHALLMTRASYETQRAHRPEERPYVICRSGCPGIQRYAQTWSGDNTSDWRALKYNTTMALGMGLSGAPNTGADVGGFAGAKPEAELFVRWAQAGALHPRFSMNSWHPDGSINEPWMYPEVLPAVREAIHFRYRLIPYLYSLFVEAAETGTPILRPLVYVFPGDPRCHAESFAFMLGPNMLAAPVLEAGARTRRVYLPAGTRWCDFDTGRWWEGGQEIDVPAPLERIPRFVPAGGIIPMGKVMRHVGAAPDDLREVYVFPDPRGGRGTFALVEDDGVTTAYARGERTRVVVDIVAEPTRLAATVSRPVAGYPLPYRSIDIILPPGEARPVDGHLEAGPDGTGRRRVRIPLL
jgi:alpha-glucosidase